MAQQRVLDRTRARRWRPRARRRRCRRSSSVRSTSATASPTWSTAASIAARRACGSASSGAHAGTPRSSGVDRSSHAAAADGDGDQVDVGAVEAAPRRRRARRATSSREQAPVTPDRLDDSDDAAHVRKDLHRGTAQIDQCTGVEPADPSQPCRRPREAAGSTAATRSSATRRPRRRSGASTMTRTSGSVPLGRTSTRPGRPARASTAAISGRDRVRRGRRRCRRQPHVAQHLGQPGHGGVGQLGQRPARSGPRRRAAASAVSRPSPVVARSRKIT